MKHLYKNGGNNQLLSQNRDPDEIRGNLRADCANCFGLCCVALYFSATEGFPSDKDAGQPCLNLQPDFRCGVHTTLMEQGLKGCVAFDCFGAGQKVSQVSFSGRDWRQNPKTAKQIFEVFLIMRQLHELLWYLTEVLMLPLAHSIHGKTSSILDETEGFTYLSPVSLLELDIPAHRNNVNALLVQTSKLVRAEAHRGEKNTSGRKKTLGRGLSLIGADLRNNDLRGENLRGAYLIATDLRGVDLSGADLIGADFRDADLRGSNLTKSIFLTQSQVNSAKGDVNTKLPLAITRPTHWAF